MTPTVEIAVVAHPQRKAEAQILACKVGAAAVSWDDAHLGPAANHQRAWDYLKDSSAEWAVVLEDDAIPVMGFRHQAEMALSVAPGDLVSFYLGRGRPDQWQLPISAAISTEVCFLRAVEMLHGVAYAIRTQHLATLLTATRHALRASNRIELWEAVSNWAKRSGHKIYYTRPSITNHADGATLCVHPDGQDRYLAPDPSGTATRKAWLFEARERWDSSWAEIPKPDLRRRDKVSRHLTLVGGV